jgi:electron transport complex protein RnfD
MKVSSSPHIRDSITASNLYLWVIVALLPAAAASIYFFRLRAAAIILVSVGSAIVVDNILQKLTNNNLGVFNGSAIITGLLLALILPPGVPLWLPVIGVVVALGVAKYAFGPGNAVFNPALVGRIFLAVSFPALMAGYLGIDGVTAATPLSIAKNEGMHVLLTQYGTTGSLNSALFTGGIAGSLGETSALALLIGGVFLIFMRVTDWRIPLVYIGTVAVLASAFGQDVLFNLFAGGLMIGAFFMATDYVTTPISRNGKIIFALGCGILTMLLRVYSVYPEGVAFSILLMNAATPLIDRLTRPRPFGK